MRTGRMFTALLAAVCSLAALPASAAVAEEAPAVSLTITTTADHTLRLQAMSRVFPIGSRYTLRIIDLTTQRPIAGCPRACPDGTLAVTTVPTADSSAASGRPHTYVARVSRIDRYSGPGEVVASSAPVTAAGWAAGLTRTDNADGTFTLRASTNYRVPGSVYSLAVLDTTTGRRIIQCTSNCSDGASVSVDTVPMAETTERSAQAHRYVAIVRNVPWPHAVENVAATSAGVSAALWTVSLAVVSNPEGTLRLTASTNYRIPGSGYGLVIRDTATGLRVAQCSGTCTDGVRMSVGAPAGAPVDAGRYVAVVADEIPLLAGGNVAATSAR